MKRLVAGAVLAATLLVGGCASEDDYPLPIATELQSRVLAVTEAAAASDLGAALDRLSELEIDVRDALARGLITQERHDSIMAAIELVRRDLEAAIKAAEEAQREREAQEQEQEQEQEQNAGNGNNGNNGRGNGNGNEGKGEGEGKGNGEGD